MLAPWHGHSTCPLSRAHSPRRTLCHAHGGRHAARTAAAKRAAHAAVLRPSVARASGHWECAGVACATPPCAAKRDTSSASPVHTHPVATPRREPIQMSGRVVSMAARIMMPPLAPPGRPVTCPGASCSRCTPKLHTHSDCSLSGRETSAPRVTRGPNAAMSNGVCTRRQRMARQTGNVCPSSGASHSRGMSTAEACPQLGRCAGKRGRGAPPVDRPATALPLDHHPAPPYLDPFLHLGTQLCRTTSIPTRA